MKNTEKVIFEGYPKRMMVWDDSTGEVERIVLCVVKNDNSPYKTISPEGRLSGWQHASDIAPEKPRTIEDGLVQGDVIVTSSRKAKILGVCGDAIIRSWLGDFDTASSVHTLKELILDGWKLESELTAQEPELVELTIQDISEGKGAGVDPKFIRIKDMVRIDL
jgi:hypothetical protein